MPDRQPNPAEPSPSAPDSAHPDPQPRENLATTPEPASSETEPAPPPSAEPTPLETPAPIPEPAPMLDVHVPQPTHTWKDFFIHVGTICVGLVIAVGLEQTVEAIQHARERHELIDEMRTEAERNIDVIHGDQDIDRAQMQWILAVIATLRASHPQGGVVTVVLPSRDPSPRLRAPARAVWTAAKTNGKVALLSDRQSALYDRLDTDAALAVTSYEHLTTAETTAQAGLFRLGIRLSPGASISIPAAEVSSVISDQAQIAAAIRETAGFYANWLADCDGIAAGVQDREDLNPYKSKEADAMNARLPQP